MLLLGKVLILMSIASALITLVGMIKPSIVMQKSRNSVLFLFFVPAVFMMLIGRSLVL